MMTGTASDNMSIGCDHLRKQSGSALCRHLASCHVRISISRTMTVTLVGIYARFAPCAARVLSPDRRAFAPAGVNAWFEDSPLYHLRLSDPTYL